MSELTLPPILYWSAARAKHPDASDLAPGLIHDTCDSIGVFATTSPDSWQLLREMPDDAVQFVLNHGPTCAANRAGEACICRGDEPCEGSSCPDSACHAVAAAARGSLL